MEYDVPYCKICGENFTRVVDPYGTGDTWYVIWEQECLCAEEEE